MLYFSYRFFLNSFYLNSLKKYSQKFFYHLLYKFNPVDLGLVDDTLSYLFGVNNLFYKYLNFVKYSYRNYQNKYLMSILLLSIIKVFCLFSRYVDRMICVIYIAYIFFVTFLFLLTNYNFCIFTNCLYLQFLKYVKRYKKNLNYLKLNFFSTLPVVNRMITILKSPHVHKKARDQYFLKTHKIGFILRNLAIFFPKTFYLNFFNSIAMKLQRKAHSVYLS